MGKALGCLGTLAWVPESTLLWLERNSIQVGETFAKHQVIEPPKVFSDTTPAGLESVPVN